MPVFVNRDASSFFSREVKVHCLQMSGLLGEVIHILLGGGNHPRVLELSKPHMGEAFPHIWIPSCLRVNFGFLPSSPHLTTLVDFEGWSFWFLGSPRGRGRDWCKNRGLFRPLWFSLGTSGHFGRGSRGGLNLFFPFAFLGIWVGFRFFKDSRQLRGG